MKKLVTLLLLAFAIVNLQAQTEVPNGDFEAWTDPYHIPDWDGLNYDGGILNFHTFSRTEDAHSGNYAAQVETINHELIGNLPGIGFTGNIDFDPVTFEYTFNVGVPVEGRPSSLKGFFKYNPAGGDTMAIVIGMFRWNDTQNDLDSIGGGFFYTENTVNQYTGFEAPIEYFDPTLEADTMYIMLFSSLDSYHPGSVLKVDDLTLNFGAVGGVETIEKSEVSVFPNPVSDVLHVRMENQNIKSEILVTDITGRVILVQTFCGQTKVYLPEQVAGGLYFAVIRQEGITVKTKKLFVER